MNAPDLQGDTLNNYTTLSVKMTRSVCNYYTKLKDSFLFPKPYNCLLKGVHWLR